LPEGLDIRLAEDVAKAIDKILIPAYGNARSPFSFMGYVAEAGLKTEETPAEYGFAASVLLYALLAGGEDYQAMDYAVTDDEIYPGLSGFCVRLAPDSDFRFTNVLDGPVMIFASVADGSLEVTIAGPSRFAGPGAAPYDIISKAEDNRYILTRNGNQIAAYHSK